MAPSLREESPVLAGQFLFLWALWMLFVSEAHLHEAWLGAAAAAVGTAADAVVRRGCGLGFRPGARDVLLGARLPWQALKGTAAVLAALARRLAGGSPGSRLLEIPFDPGEDGDRCAGRRVLAVAYTDVSPDSIVVDVDPGKGILVLHQLPAAGVPLAVQRLGARG